jgi:thiamine biosynthesis lipoprotein
MGTLNTVVVEDPGALPEAMRIVEAEIRAIDEACSRFREESELSRLNARAGSGFIAVSPLLEEAILSALGAAGMTGGLCDPTVGKAVAGAGYSVTFTAMVKDGPAADVSIAPVAGWTSIRHDPGRHAFALPSEVCLDLGASGKAWAADRAAAAVKDRLRVGVAVECGGDMAVSGPHPQGGWPVRVAADTGAAEFQDIAVYDGGLATSGTTSRRWRRGGVEMHHIIDPATGLPAQTPWAFVSVAAATCLEANAAATAALVMGDAAPAWLDRLRLPARLVDHGGSVRYAGGWSS